MQAEKSVGRTKGDIGGRRERREGERGGRHVPVVHLPGEVHGGGEPSCLIIRKEFMK